jgi:hypothetical protein
MNTKQIYVTKISGEKALFDEEKLRNSLKRSKADDDTIDKVIEKVKIELKDSITTKEIYRMAFTYLRKNSSHSAARYKLKQSILELGPTGFPFEDYISELLKYKNYTTEVGKIVNGHCITHEIDIIAERDNRHILLECKFHSDQRRFCDVKVPLYIHSRFKDVEEELKKKAGHNDTVFIGGLVTNTRFSSDALKYGLCMGMYLLSWDYPAGKSLKSLIDQSGLHPITSLLTITKDEKMRLLSQGFILCKSLADNPAILKTLPISPIRTVKILQEVNDICVYT